MNVAERLQGAALLALIGAIRRLGPRAASDLGGNIARAIGPWLPVSRVADANLAAAWPKLDVAGRHVLVRRAWEQLGRTAFEFPHIAALPRDSPTGPGWEVTGQDVLAGLSARGGPAIFFSGHLGNWEILPRAAAQFGLPIASFYRAAGNPGFDRVICAEREAAGAQAMFAKGRTGARQAMAHLRGGGKLAMLVDQKLNDGIEARFFGRPAMTAPAAASFALHFRCPLIPVVVRRTGPARLLVRVEPPLSLPGVGDRAANIAALTQTMNDTLERWIREDPPSWLWLHRRWPKA